ncbi:MAG: hypothetical protein WKG00_41660 [Polyangiaceae bacterium]
MNEASSAWPRRHARAAPRLAWLIGVAALLLGGTLTACSSDDAGDGGPGEYGGSRGAGGDSVGTGNGPSSTSGSVTSGGAGAAQGAGGGGTTGVGGGGGGPVQECFATCAVDHSEGQVTYDEYASCIYCGECANDCADEAFGMCVDPPTGDACDNGGNCALCTDCANGSGCSNQAEACSSQPDCVAYANCLAMCEHY